MGPPYGKRDPYYSHIIPILQGILMGMVWEAYHKGVPLLVVPENPIDPFSGTCKSSILSTISSILSVFLSETIGGKKVGMISLVNFLRNKIKTQDIPFDWFIKCQKSLWFLKQVILV